MACIALEELNTERKRLKMSIVSLKLQRKLELLHHPSLSHSIQSTIRCLPDLLSTHALLLTTGLLSNPFTLSRLLAVSALSPSSPNPHHHATSLFHSVPFPSLSMFNTMIRAFANIHSPHHSFSIYKHLLTIPLSPDRFTFPFLLRSSTSSSLPLGRSVHCHSLKLGLDSDIYVTNNTISMYCSWGRVDSARRIFDKRVSADLDVVSWTAMLTGYSNLGQMNTARRFFDTCPNKNHVAWNAMIAGYARAGMKDDALRLFGEMPQRNVASWGSVVSGFAQSGLCKDALAVFRGMVRVGVSPNEATLVSAVSACAQLRDLRQGEWVGKYIEENVLSKSTVLATAIVDMYGKGGNISKAIDVFGKMPIKNVYSWNSMIAGLANCGFGKQALTLFWKMKLAGIAPNDVTFIGLLSACSHSRLVDEGRWFFDMMTRVYEIRPLEEHYGCIVDLLARAGMIKAAVNFMDRMPVEAHPGLLGALAGGCRIHGELEIGERVAKRLIELEPNHGGRYLLLANIYAAARRWDDVCMVRKMLKERKVLKIAGNSLVELKSVA